MKVLIANLDDEICEEIISEITYYPYITLHLCEKPCLKFKFGNVIFFFANLNNIFNNNIFEHAY